MCFTKARACIHYVCIKNVMALKHFPIVLDIRANWRMVPFTNEKIVYLTGVRAANSIYNYKTGHFFINVLIKNTPLKEDEKQINILKYWLL